MKICSRCGQNKKLDEFHRDSSKSSGRHSVCTECKNQKAANWRQDNPDYSKEYMKEWNSRNSDYFREWRKKNPGYYTKYNKQRKQIIDQKPQDKFNNLEVFNHYEWVCQLCGDMVDPDLEFPSNWSASLDHYIPVKSEEFPGHVWDNVWLAHLKCNRDKRNKTP